MKFVLEGPFEENVLSLMRNVGYYPQGQNDKKGEMIFIRPLERSGYPRFHIYLKVEDENLVFNLHLDQKRPIYKSVPAHAGEYDGTVVEKEAERIKQILQE